MKSLYCAALALSSSWLASCPTAANAAVGFRQLTSVHPVAVQRGKKTTVAVRSNFTLDGAYRVFFDEPGITMTYAEAKPINAPLTGRGRPGTPFHFTVDVPARQTSRVYEFRVSTKQAVSSVSHLLVTDFPVVVEKTTDNATAALAQPLPVPVALCGVCEKAEDVDHYRFDGKAGQEITLEVFAQRVTEAIHDMVSSRGYHMNAILTVLNSHGQVIAQNDNTFGADPVLHLKLPADGAYTVEIRDTRFAGDPRYSYCLEISERPWVRTVFPPAIQRGKSVRVEPIGFGLGKTGHVALSAAANDPLGWKLVRLDTARGPTNPVKILVSSDPEVVVPPGHTSTEHALPIRMPVGLSGRFTEPGKAHYFSFEGQKGQFYAFEVDANRHGLPVDCIVRMYNDRGARLVELDDMPTGKDPRVFFQAPADGRYFVSIADLDGRSGPEYVYHLRAVPSGPDFELSGEYYYAMLAPGTRAIWFAKVNRLNGFAGPVELEVTGLPPGVSATPVTMPAPMTQCAIILSAAKDAKVGAALARVRGRAQVAGVDGKPRTIVHEGDVTCELQSQGGGQGRWPIRTQLVGVVEKLDLKSVVATPDEVRLVPGGAAEIKVGITRDPAFTDPVGLEMAFTYFTIRFGEQLPPGVKMAAASKTRLTGKTLEGTIVLEAAKTAAPVERLPIAVIAGASVSFSINTLYASNPVFLTIAPAANPAGK